MRKISRCVHVYQSVGFPIQGPWLTPQVVSEDTFAQRTQQGLVLGILCQSTHLLEGGTVRVKHTPAQNQWDPAPYGTADGVVMSSSDNQSGLMSLNVAISTL